MRKSYLLVAAIAAASSVFAANQARAELAYATTLQGFVVSFDTDAPQSILSSYAINGLGNNEVVIGIDLRPSTGALYAVGSFGTLYNLNPSTGAATLVASLTSEGSTVFPNGTNFGADFNPTVDRLRFVSNADQNLRINPDTGVTIVDGTLNYPASPDTSPNIVHVAYTNNFSGATSTVLYGIDAGTSQLVSFLSPNAGTLQNVGPLGFDFNELGGFDISGLTGTAYAVMIRATESQSHLFQIDLATGTATDLGQVGGGPLITGFTLAAIPEPSSLALLAPATLLLTRRRK